MSFILSPTNIEDYDWIFKNPRTDVWTIPVLTFNSSLLSPYVYEIDPLNNDINYQSRTIDYFLTKLTEKWLHKKQFYNPLLKYFTVTKSGDKGTVTLISNPEKISDKEMTGDDYKYVLMYIEKFFLKRRFVEKSLRTYINASHMKWYDLYSNSDIVKKLFRHKLKKLIIKTIYALEKESK
jgi:hypothetical protein